MVVLVDAYATGDTNGRGNKGDMRIGGSGRVCSAHLRTPRLAKLRYYPRLFLAFAFGISGAVIFS